jgi:D-serine deaminase-like pyridoxal phosphate-dependent protein
VDLVAMAENRRAVVQAVGENPVTIRLSTRSMRSTALLRRLLMDPTAITAEGPPDPLQGLACDSVTETAALIQLGFDDILLHAPICLAADAERAARLVAEGARVVATVDCREHVDLLAAAAVALEVQFDVCIDVDVSWQPAAEVRFGRLRSPIGDVSSARDLGLYIGETDGVRVVGVSAWESAVADSRRPAARRWWTGPFHGFMHTRASGLAADRRVAVVESLKSDGHAISIINGGSSATLPTTVADGSVSEVTVGAAFLCPTRCDSLPLDLTPAVHFAARVCRIPDSEHVVVRGAGNGDPARVAWPGGLRHVAGERLSTHQTPLRVTGATPALGSPVVFRPAEVAPTFDRFEEVLLVDETGIVERATTYRGIGISDR